MIDRPLTYFITHVQTGDKEQRYLELRTKLEHHIETGDFFLLLATLFGFLEDSVADPESMDSEDRMQQIELARSLRGNLAYVAEHYRITPRSS